MDSPSASAVVISSRAWGCARARRNAGEAGFSRGYGRQFFRKGDSGFRNRRTCDFSLTGCSFPWTTTVAVICFSRSRTPPGVPPPTPPPNMNFITGSRCSAHILLCARGATPRTRRRRGTTPGSATRRRWRVASGDWNAPRTKRARRSRRANRSALAKTRRPPWRSPWPDATRARLRCARTRRSPLAGTGTGTGIPSPRGRVAEALGVSPSVCPLPAARGACSVSGASGSSDAVSYATRKSFVAFAYAHRA